MTKPLELSEAARSGAAALADGATGFSSKTERFLAERAHANLDMRGGGSRDDDGFSLDHVNQTQGVGQAFCDAKARANWLEGGRIGIGHPDHLDVGPFSQPAEMLLAEGAEASKQQAKRTG